MFVYNTYMKLIRKKGFTLVEAVVTIGVLTMVVTMTSLVIFNMVNIQKATAAQYEINEEIDKAYKVAEEYVSFVSVNNDELRFTYVPNTTTSSLTFSCNEYNFSLKYLDNYISYGCDTSYLGDNDYLKQNKSVELHNVDSLSFNYDNDIKLLVMDISISGRVSHESFYLRTA